MSTEQNKDEGENSEKTFYFVDIPNTSYQVLNDVFSKYALTFQTIGRTYRGYLDSFAEVSQRISQQMRETHFLIQQVFREWLEQENIRAEEIGPYFEEASFWISPSMFSLPFWRTITELHSEGRLTTQILTEMVLELFSKDDHKLFREMVEKWENRSEFLEWRHVIQDAAEVHIQGKYNLSVPPILMVIDSIICDIYGLKTLETRNLIKHFKVMWPDRPLYAVNSRPFITTFERFYQKQKKSKVSLFPEGFRHIVLHGAEKNYGTPLNSLRVFMLLDELHRLCDSSED